MTDRAVRRNSAIFAFAIGIVIVVVLLENVLIGRYFPTLLRVVTDFSPTYLIREMRSLAGRSSETIFLGDSVVWGYRLKADESVVSVLARRGCQCINLAFKAGSPPNYYALVRMMEANDVRPRAVVLEVNQKVFNPADPSYQSLHPALEAAALSLFLPDDRARLTLSASKGVIQERADEVLSRVWTPYAMRSDIRETILGDSEGDGEKPEALTSDMLEGSYDLRPLREDNVGVHFLEETADRLRADGIPTIAFMTPQNHRLLHDYIDNAQYAARGAYLARVLRARGVRVVDLDAAFPPDAFLDEVHLTAGAQKRLASMLESSAPTAIAAR